jgi:hypothetical protein
MFDFASRNPTPLLERFLTAEVSRSFDFRTIFWFVVSLCFSMAFASRALQQAFSSQYVLQDDARHHVFWMARFVDPGLFPHDLIADYFQSIAPAGYTALYRAMASIGLDPFIFSKLLPMALGLITTAFCFAVSMQILRVPAAAFTGSLLLNQSLWMRNGLVSATPRAFISPLFLAFMFFLLRRSVLLCLVSIALMGLFFPSTMFIALGVLLLSLVRWERRRPHFSHERRDYILCAAGLAIAIIVMLPYAFKSSGFGPVVTASEGRTMAEFLPGGRMVVFRQDFWSYWITGSHTGMFSSAVFSPITMCLGLLLLILMFFPKRFPLIERISSGVALLPRIILASLAMFFAANALLFRLYLPSRFTVNSFRILLALAAGISAVVILDSVYRWRPPTAVAATGLLGALLILPFIAGTVIDTRYKTGKNPQLYEFLARQPKDILIASLASDVENLPMFARRSILVGREIALPFHKGYYTQIRQRIVDLVNAQYSPDIRELDTFIRKYGVTYLLVDRNAFTPEYAARDKWIMQHQPAVKERLKEGVVPALSILMEQCSVFETNGLVLISADCILKASSDKTSSTPLAQ